MTMSLYHSATGTQAPHCIHAIGIGRTGAYMVEALLRTGEIEDLMADPRARFTGLSIDIGEQDQWELKEYAAGLEQRMSARDIPFDRVQMRTVSLEVPSKDELMATVAEWPHHLAAEYPRFSPLTQDEPWLPDVELPAAGESIPRAIAKAIYGHNYYAGEKILAKELDDFVASVNSTKLPSIVLIFFSMAGGTGSGMVVDLARHLSTERLGRRLPVVGIASMPFSGDEPHAGGPAELYPVLNEIDCMLDDTKNQAIAGVWGDLYRNPFTGGFLALPQEHSWKRLGSYTKTGTPAIRDALRKGVTRKFINDSFCRFVVQQQGRLLFKMLRPAGFTGAPHERNISGDRTFTVFDVAKLTHPGVEVLPGEPRSKWRAVVSKWIDYIPTFSGLADGFVTDYIEAHTVAPRELWNPTLQARLESVLGKYVLPGEDGTLNTSVGEFFDELTAYTNIIIPGVAKTDFTAFYEARTAYDAVDDATERALMHSWLLDLGTLLSEQPSGDNVELVAFDAIRGEAPVSPDITSVQAEHIGPLAATVVPTP